MQCKYIADDKSKTSKQQTYFDILVNQLHEMCNKYDDLIQMFSYLEKRLEDVEHQNK